MVRKEGRLPRPLDLKVPTFFRCPISLEVMRSPVSLCTGVTYDRASIQRWLDSGNSRCPATMQPLPSTDLVPNLTLRRLINLWSSTSAATIAAEKLTGGDILRDLSATGDPLHALCRLTEFFADTDVDDFDKNNLVSSGSCAAALSSLLIDIKSSEAAVGVISQLLSSDCIEDRNKETMIAALATVLDGSTIAIVNVMKIGSLNRRIDAARVLERVLASADTRAKAAIAEKRDLLPELIRLIGPAEAEEKIDRRAAEAGLGCLAEFLVLPRLRSRMVEAGLVPVLAAALAAETSEVPVAAVEKALRLVEYAAGCAEGRAAISERAGEVVGAVVSRMMKVGRDGREAAAVALWSLCRLFSDRRAQEAVAAADRGLTKILLLMQSDCSPAVRQMTGDLLKIFRVNSKSCLAGYDTKTTHIMPF